MNELKPKNFTLDTETLGVCRVLMDVPGKPLNVLDESAMRELDSIVRQLETNRDYAVVTFESSKESGFLAGADVTAIESIETSEQADRLLLAGQELFARIESLPMTTVALIHGPCLGGGLEMALACDYRIARDNSSTQIGLPEIKLGFLPAWGGTQRLPRVVGAKRALQMILQGKTVSAKDAFRCGLVDLAIAPEEWKEESYRFIDAVKHGRFQRRPRKRRWLQWMLESNVIGRKLLFHLARKNVAKQAGHYPALASVISAIEDGFDPNADGYRRERAEFGRLIQTPTCRSLLGLFFSRERARKPATWVESAESAVHDAPIRHVGIVGAGTMGAGIALASASRGFDVSIKEVDLEAADAGLRRVEGLIDEYARHKKLSTNERESLSARIRISHDPAMLSACDLIIEAVVERLDVKRSVLDELCADRQPHTILASNTSSLSVDAMADATNCPEKVAGLHFFNPVQRMELVEIVRASHTDEATVAKLVAYVRALGKTPIVTKDVPGFLVNRILFPYLGEAIRMVGEGSDIEAIDRSARAFGMPMGPLELLDKIGLDVALHVASALKISEEDAKPVFAVLKRRVDAGMLGIKSGRGFYDHSGKKPRPVVMPIDAVHLQTAPHPFEFDDDGLTALQRRLVYPMLRESVRCQEEEVVAFPWAMDLAMVLGTGFAPHRGGPMRMIERIGAKHVLANLRLLAEQHGRRFDPPARLIEMGEGNGARPCLQSE